MNEKIKSYVTLAGNVINKLPFKKLSEKYADKVPVLKSIAPFANFIVCGLVVILIAVKIIVPQVKFNSYMSKIEKPWKEEVQSYEALDFSEEFKAVFDKVSAEMDNYAKDGSDIEIAVGKKNSNEQLKDLRKLRQTKYDELEKLSNLSKEAEKQLEDIIRITMWAKLDEISNKSSAEIGNVKNYDSVMSNGQFNRYKKLTEELPMQLREAWEQCISRNTELYTDYTSKLETMYSGKTDKINATIDKINTVIKEINRKAYIDFVQKSIVGYWVCGNYKLEFYNGNFECSFKKDEVTFKRSGPERIYARDDGVVVATSRIGRIPLRSQYYSGKYSFQDDVLILDVEESDSTNMPEIKSGERIKMQISFSDNGNTLRFDKRTYKRD